MGKYKGMAPGCSLISLKVLDRFRKWKQGGYSGGVSVDRESPGGIQDPDRKYFGRDNV